VRISREFGLNQTQYGNVEAVFGYAFAAGSLVFGWLADRVSLRWLYALVLALWSVAGFVTGFVKSYDELLVCRMLLGFFEAGHWPCAIRTTRMLLDARQRSMGNGLLQSGASLGAIITPLIMQALMTSEQGSWRLPFLVVGGVGMLWLIPWFVLLRGNDLRPPVADSRPLPTRIR
jgi:MFS transporter, ACS family, hexuronate transporter